MTYRLWLLSAVLFSGAACFQDAAPTPEVEADDDDDTANTDAVTSGSSTPGGTTTSGEPETSSNVDGTTTDEPVDETTDTGSTTEDPCPLGAQGCPCGDACLDELTCVRGTCTSCGDGTIDAPEQCDGPVEGGACESCVLVCDGDHADCDGQPDNGCEVDLRTPENCGACEHDCLGGACEEQECQPVDLAQSQGQPLGLDVEGGTIFWTNVTGGEVYEHSVQPGGPPTLITNGLNFPETVVADGSKVYWANSFGGGIGRANYDGSLPEPLWLPADPPLQTRLLINGPSHLYLMRVSAGAYRVNKVNADPVQAEVGSGSAWGGFLDGDILYWADHGMGAIRRADVSAQPFTPETVIGGQTTAYAVYVHDGVIYWTTDGTGEDGTVNSMPVGGGDTIQFVSDGRFPEDIVVDDDYVYWVEWSTSGNLHRARHDGSEVTPLLPAHSAGIEQDDEAIYWVDQNGGRIRKLAKPPQTGR